MSFIILRGLWCDIIILNVHVPKEDKVDDIKDRFYEELQHVFDKFPKAADCITDQYLVVAEVGETLTVSKQTVHRVHMERFNLKKLNKVEGKEQYRVEISNWFTTLENSDTDVDINKAWETLRSNLVNDENGDLLADSTTFCFQCNRSTTDQIFCICQIQDKKKWEYNETVHRLQEILRFS
ncbi:hypothetical protein B7P43_G01414 [Cryptotermes secundus]|uniref:Uncharacterized protein n=1 Tax=Cryptotermes secundus TaxID=105785 RepID=A0A2J7R249_9NEOP|nr:hypothetical protein B7P43_G01414 [Cryptotermes secundus]